MRRPAALALALVVCLGLFVADRLMVLDSSGHLLFDLNNAEYGFVRALLPHLDQPWTAQLADRATRDPLLHDLRTVGNQVHGSLALFGLALLALLQDAGAPLATATLRGLSLALSTTALGLWWWTLTRQSGRLRAGLVLTGLWVAAPMVLLELTLVAWGTHEVALLLHAVLVAAVAPALGPAPGPGRAALRVALVGAGGALLTLGSYSLLMPVAFTAGWLVLMGAVGTGRRHGRVAGLVALPLLGTLAVGAWGLGFDLVLQTRWLDGLGMPPRLPAEGFLHLPGKHGASFLHRAATSPAQVHLWSAEVQERAMVLVPGAAYGAAARAVEPVVRLALLGLGALLPLGALLGRGRRRTPGGAALSAYLGTYLVVGWLGVTVLSQTHGFERGVAEHCPPRYYAHLFPVALAVLALWAARGRAWRLLPAGAVLFFGAWTHAFTLDAAQLRAPSVYDGVRLWARTTGPPDLPPLRDAPLAGASPAYLDGLALLTRFQFRDYWRWVRPDEVTEVRVLDAIRQHSGRFGAGAADPDFQRGLGHAVRVLLPPGREAGVLARMPALAEGYRGAPAMLAGSGSE